MDREDLLHVLNGQCLYEYFKNEGWPQEGIYIPFNEAMCWGETTETIFSEGFNHCRAIVHQVTSQEYEKITLKPLRHLFEQKQVEIYLWFDTDMFCQINLLTILAYLEQQQYKGSVIYCMIDHDFSMIGQYKIDLIGYEDVYKDVLINKEVPKMPLVPTMQKGINRYLEYLKEENEITTYIRQQSDMTEELLLEQLFQRFKEYGLGDIQYKKIIEKINS